MTQVSKLTIRVGFCESICVYLYYKPDPWTTGLIQLRILIGSVVLYGEERGLGSIMHDIKRNLDSSNRRYSFIRRGVSLDYVSRKLLLSKSCSTLI